MLKDTGNAGQSCELVSCDFGESAYMSIVVPVNLVSRVDFPTEGKPIMPTLASPDLDT